MPRSIFAPVAACVPTPRFTISYLRVGPRSASDIPEIERQVHAAGYPALTNDEFVEKISKFLPVSEGDRHQPADHD
jgi:putative ABC transport system permease protein